MTNFNYINLLNTLSTNYNLSFEMLANLHMYGMYGTGANDSMNNHLYCPPIQMPMANLISMVLYSFVGVVGLLGNSLVIYVVLRFSNMQTITNLFILNLAFADMCFLIGIPFLITTMYLGEWTFGMGLCKVYMVSTSITQFTSSIFLFIMSADRYLAVCHPISSPRYRTPFISRVVSVLAWTMSVIFMLPVMLYANEKRTHLPDFKQKASCIIEWPEDEEVGGGSGTTFILYSLILGFAIPLALILGFYYLVLKKLRTVGPKNKSKEKKRSHRKVTKLVLTVIAVYVLCWLPYWIGQVALIHSPPDLCKSRLEITIFVLVGCLGYSNSAMNPILYAFLSDNFKKSFLKACTCATGNDPGGQLQFENSFFPRFVKSANTQQLNVNANNNNNASMRSRVVVAARETGTASGLTTGNTTAATMVSNPGSASVAASGDNSNNGNQFCNISLTMPGTDGVLAESLPLNGAGEGRSGETEVLTAGGQSQNPTTTVAALESVTVVQKQSHESYKHNNNSGCRGPVLHTDL